MKLFKTLIVIIGLLSSINSFSQEETNNVYIISRAQEKSILLRIAPGSPSLWELGNKYGYYIERFTVTRGSKYLGNRERVLLTNNPLKPLPLPQWEPLANTNEFAEITAEAIYGETFELSTNFDQDIMQVYTKAKELESRFSFALFSSDISLDVAQASGLYFKDNDVRKDEKYLYRVYAAIPQNIMPTDTGFVYTSLEDYAPLPEIKDVKIQFADKLAMISWNTRYLQSFYSAYWVERSEDGKDFKRITELPYVNLNPDNVTDPGVAYKIDSLAENNKTYHYRIIGISPFGEISKPSEAVKGEGIEALGAAPAIRKVETLNEQARIQWEFDKASEKAIKGFEVERSMSSEMGYKVISPLLAPSTRDFIDKQPEGTNYYKIKAIGKGEQKSFSFPTLYQLEDSIPPLPPTGLTGYVDTTGVVTLVWNKNTERDLGGYRVFRSNFKSAEFSQVTSTPVDTAGFKEKIPLQNLTKEVYYKIQAFDTRFNPSEYSVVIKLVKPDVVPPVPPVFKSWKADKDKLQVVWTASASKDVKSHVLKIKSFNDSVWSVTKIFKVGEAMEFSYSNLKGGKYEIKVEAVDSANNVTPSKNLAVNIHGEIRKSIEGVRIAADRTTKNIVLTWKYNEADATKIMIYRAEGEKPVTLYKTIPGTSQQFIDDQVVINITYTYYLKVVFINGEESTHSKKIEVNY